MHVLGLQALAWRSLRARPLRTSLTVAGVALGVAVLFAGLSTNAAIEAAVDRSVGSVLGRADLRVGAFGEAGLSAETLDGVQRTPGVVVAAPALERRTYLGLEAIGPGDALPPPVTVLGVDPSVEPALHDHRLAAGAPLARMDEPSALISASLAAEDGLVVGSELTLQGPGDPVAVRVVGVLADDGPAGGPSGRLVILPLATAQTAFDTTGLSRIDVGLAGDATIASTTVELEGRLLGEPYVVSTASDIAESMRASTGDVMAMTTLIAAVVLFAGAFLMVNTLSMTVIERVRELGLLRAAGATRGQLTGFILVQALLIGAAGAAIGLVIGILLALGMLRWIETIGEIALTDPVIEPRSVAVAAAMSFVVTLVAAIEPARRAGRIPPVEALKARLDPPTARHARQRWLAAIVGLVGIVGILVSPRWTDDAALARAIAVYGGLLLVVLGLPFALGPLARVAGVPFASIARLEERLARASVLRDRSRASLTAGALTVGVAMIVALGGVSAGARAAAGSWIDDVVPGDLVVASIFPRAADEGLDETLGSVPGVAAVSPMASFDLAIAGVRTDAAVLVGADLAADGRFRLIDGERDAALTALDAGGAVIVPAAMASRTGVVLGDQLMATGIDGTVVTLSVAGIADRTPPGSSGEAVVVGWPDAGRLGVAGADAFAVRFSPSATEAERLALADEARALALDPVPLARIQGAIGHALDRVFGLFDALALVAVLVAALGIVNTLTMSVLERVREIGVLRATGMTRRQVWRSVVVEAGVTGAIGVICGVATGLAIGILVSLLAGGRSEHVVTVPWSVVGLAAALGLGLSVLAAVYPARVASRISIVRAVGYD